MSNKPTPPEGYEVMLGRDVPNPCPEGMHMWNDNMSEWQNSLYNPGWALHGHHPSEYPTDKTGWYAFPKSTPKPEAPQPPEGYRIVSIEEMPASVPEGAMVCYPEYRWARSTCCGNMTRDNLNEEGFYAIPNDKMNGLVPYAAPVSGIPKPPDGYKLVKGKAVPREAFGVRKWVGGNTWESHHWHIRTDQMEDWFALPTPSDPDPFVDAAANPTPASPLDEQIGGQHYKSMAIQPVTFITRNKLTFLEGCVVKRVCRHRTKNGAEDIRKAIHELELILQLEYPTQP